jgi:hypothetical protein
VDEAIAADRDPDMRHVPAFRGEEHEIPGRELVEPYADPQFVLVTHDAWDRNAVLGKHILHEPAAVEASQI